MHKKYKAEKQDVQAKMHTLRMEYLTVNGIDSKETRRLQQAGDEGKQC